MARFDIGAKAETEGFINNAGYEGPWRGPLARSAITELKILSPSSPPSSFSAACSGWGMRPSTLRPSLVMPATLFIDPFGLASEVARPFRST